METTDCNKKKVHLSLWNQDLVFAGSWALRKLNNPGHITCVILFLASRINIFNELSSATDIDDLHLEIKLSDSKYQVYKFLQRISITFFWWWWGSEVNGEGHVLSLIFIFFCADVFFLLFLNLSFVPLFLYFFWILL